MYQFCGQLGVSTGLPQSGLQKAARRRAKTTCEGACKCDGSSSRGRSTPNAVWSCSVQQCRPNVDPVAGLAVNLEPIRPLIVIRQLFGVGRDVKNQTFFRIHESILQHSEADCQVDVSKNFLNNHMSKNHHHKRHHDYECYGKLVDFIEDLIEALIEAEKVLEHYFCHHCKTETVHRLFRENPDGSFDEVGLKCHTCKKIM